MNMHDAEVGDVYADKDGKLWRVLTTCKEPTVCVEEVEPSSHSSEVNRGLSAQMASNQAQYQNTLGAQTLSSGYFIRKKKEGGISGLMWEGFQRIMRKRD